MRVLQINKSDVRGGAAQVALKMHLAWRKRGIEAHFLVDRREGDVPGVARFVDRDRPFWGGSLPDRFRAWLPQARGRVKGAGYANRLMNRWDEWRLPRMADRGLELENHPASRLLDPERPRVDILHCHNLHRDYFDLRLLPALSRSRPTFVTLHDAWLLAGHCAHSFDCERWRSGCQDCPDLAIYTPLKTDSAHLVWAMRRQLYRRSRLYVGAPSKWLIDKVEGSILKAGAVETRVIPHGIDLSIFKPGDKARARAELDLPEVARIVLMTGYNLKSNGWKDPITLKEAVGRVAEGLTGEQVIFLVLGGAHPPERVGRAEVWYLGYETDERVVARYYQAADIYAHSSKADTYPNSVLEAAACGLPVVATGVGGIPEQIRSLDLDWPGRVYDPDQATGVLVRPADGEAMAEAFRRLIREPDLARRLSDNAADHARQWFGVELMTKTYFDWYLEVLDKTGGKIGPGSGKT